MNFNEAEMLVVRMSQAWGRAPGDEWISAMQDLDAGRAGTAFIRLRDSKVRQPSIAEFREAYNAVRGETDHGPACDDCANTGMTYDHDDRSEWGTSGRPCHCDHGSRMAAVAASAGSKGPVDRRLSNHQRRIGLENLRALGWARNVPANVLDELGMGTAKA